eukprot:6195885-Heterocapsa_arctica.AAC.1
MARSELDRVVTSVARAEDVRLLQRRHHDNLLVIPVTNDEWICVQPRIGDAQGDVCAPEKFSMAFDNLTENELENNSTLLTDLALQ